jgi:hypothetical protein
MLLWPSTALRGSRPRWRAGSEVDNPPMRNARERWRGSLDRRHGDCGHLGRWPGVDIDEHPSSVLRVRAQRLLLRAMAKIEQASAGVVGCP